MKTVLFIGGVASFTFILMAIACYAVTKEIIISELE